MQVAVVGAGFMGLALTYEFSKRGAEVTLFDAVGIGAGASGLCPGLLHLYTGAQAKSDAQEVAGFEATLRLLEIAGPGAIRGRGILRLPQSEKQEKIFRQRVEEQSDLEWRDGLYIKSGLTVNALAYLQGLWRACEALGAKLVIQKVEEPLGFDRVFFATAQSKKMVKGQLLRLAWPSSLKPPPCSIIGSKYLVMEDAHTCLVGATYEHAFEDEKPNLELAKQLILPGIAKIYPQLLDAEVLDIRVGLRAMEGAFALGSKGLLRHALLAQIIIDENRIS